MSITAHFDRLHRYNAWADRHLLASMLNADHSLIPERALMLFAHTQTARLTWYTRISGGDTSQIELFPHAPISACLPLLEAADAQWLRLRPALKDDAIDQPIRYKDSMGTEFSTPLIDALTQVFDHNTYHRAQIISLIKAGGIELPSPVPTYISFWREDNKAKQA